MSKVPIYDLRAKRHELDGSSKGLIYLSKIALGAMVGVPFAILSIELGVHVTVAYLMLVKMVYYARHPDRSIEWDAYCDWAVDCVLSLAWYAVLCLWAGEYAVPIAFTVVFVALYPFSCE